MKMMISEQNPDLVISVTSMNFDRDENDDRD